MYTNIKPLIYVPRTARLSAVEHRQVGDFHFNIKIIFNIKYRAQSMNTDANTVKAPIKTSGENDRTYRHHVTRSYLQHGKEAKQCKEMGGNFVGEWWKCRGFAT